MNRKEKRQKELMDHLGLHEDKELAKMNAVIEKARLALPLHTEGAKIRAQHKKAYYDALVEVGFKPDQAFELTKLSP